MLVIDNSGCDEHGGQAYVDNGDIRICVLRIKPELSEIRAYGLSGDVANAELYLEALTEAIKIAKQFDAVCNVGIKPVVEAGKMPNEKGVTNGEPSSAVTASSEGV